MKNQEKLERYHEMIISKELVQKLCEELGIDEEIRDDNNNYVYIKYTDGTEAIFGPRDDEPVIKRTDIRNNRTSLLG